MPSPAKLLDSYYALTGWCEAVAATGASVRLLQAFHLDADLAGPNGVSYVFRAASSPWLRAHRLHMVIAEDVPDVVHVNGLDAPLQTWLLRRTLPSATAVVAQDHGGAPSGQWSTTNVIRGTLLRGADAFLFSAPDLARPWLRAGCIADPSAVHPVLSASTTLDARRKDEAREATGVDGAPAVLWVGRLSAVKDPMTVLEGFEMALHHAPSATLTMVYQEDALLGDVKRKVSSSRLLSERVTLRGPVPHRRLADWYSAADLFVLGSEREVCGYAVIEACACGAIPVVTDIPAFRAITAGGSVGMLWQQGNARALADAIVAVSNRDLIEERRRVIEHFERTLSWASVGRQARGVYDTVVARRRGSAR